MGVLIVVLASLVLGLVGARIVQGVSDSNARKVLKMVADADAERVAAGLPAKPDALDPTALDRVAVHRGTIRRAGPGGPPRVTGTALAREALTPAQAQRVLEGEKLSTVIRRDGVTVFVEARPTREGGLVVAQRRPDGLTQQVADEALPVWTWAAAGVAVAGALLAMLLAWLTGRPLRRLAGAAADLAEGHRDVALPESGPAEVATLAAEFNALAAALARSEARQREFLMSVSHDLRTPLTTLAGYAETLADPDAARALDPEAVQQAGAIMGAEAARLERMVADLLTLARLEADEVALDIRTLDAADLVRDAARAWAPRCEAAGLALRLHVPSSALPVSADGQRLRQVLDNLLDNAVRVCPPGAPIVLAARADVGGSGPAGPTAAGAPAPPSVVLEVRDGGPGLTEDDLAVAFERGALRDRYRGRREVGTGLGLTLVDRLVARMGGTVKAGRAAEGGASFTIRLPAATAAPQAGGTPPPPAGGNGTSRDGDAGGTGPAQPNG